MVAAAPEPTQKCQVSHSKREDKMQVLVKPQFAASSSQSPSPLMVSTAKAGQNGANALSTGASGSFYRREFPEVRVIPKNNTCWNHTVSQGSRDGDLSPHGEQGGETKQVSTFLYSVGDVDDDILANDSTWMIFALCSYGCNKCSQCSRPLICCRQ